MTALTVMSFVLTGCDGGSDGKTVLKFFGWGSVAEQQIFKTLIKQFTDLYAKYEVVYTSVTSDNYIATLGSYKNNPRNMPDVFYMPDVNFVQWIHSSDIMMDITSYVDESEVFDLDNVWLEGINAYRYDADADRLGQGSIYALPKDLGPNVLVYNKTLAVSKGVSIISDALGQHGYNPTTKTLNDKVPMTWAQFINFCDDINEGPLSSSNSIVGITHYPLQSAVASMGTRFLDSSNKTVQIANNAFAESLQFVADLSNKYEVMTTAEGQQSQTGFQRFSSGLAGSSFVGAWDTPELWECNFDWDVLYTPVPNANGDLEDWQDGYRVGASSRSYLGSVGLSVYKNTKSPDGAYRLAEFLTMNETAQRTNYLLGQAVPNLIDMASGEFLDATLSDPKNEAEGYNRPQNREVFIDMLQNSERRPEAYTYNDDWFVQMWESSQDRYKLFRVWSTSSAYGGHVDVWDWDIKQRINNFFLDGLQTLCQNELDKTANKYNW